MEQVTDARCGEALHDIVKGVVALALHQRMAHGYHGSMLDLSLGVLASMPSLSLELIRHELSVQGYDMAEMALSPQALLIEGRNLYFNKEAQDGR
jgi:hypothetical protein